MSDFDDFLERIENERADADYAALHSSEAGVTLSLADCDELAKLLTSAFGPLLMGNREPDLAEKLTLLASAFEGEGGGLQDDNGVPA
jgi:hypothetical protein